MAVPVNPSVFFPIGIGVLVVWRSYYRIRRMIGRQKLSKFRPWVTVTVFPLVTVGLIVGSVAHLGSSLPMLAAGLFVGIALGVYGLRVTKFEITPEGMFYTPSAHVGIALSLLFIGRVVYRFVQLYAFSGDPSAPPGAGPGGGPQVATTPLTLLIFGTLAGYYVTYAIGLLRWRSNSGTSPPTSGAA
jgi:hypothetical protein